MSKRVQEISATGGEDRGPGGEWRTLMLRAREVARNFRHHAVTQDRERVDAVLKQDCQKQDDAEVPTHLWAKHLEDTRPAHLGSMPEAWEDMVEPIRMLLLRRWRRNLMRSFVAYRHT